MLTALSIRNVVLIEALDLEFGSGLTVLTGETGAGKSILLDALGLAMGARADSGLVRHGADKAMVTASFPAPGEGTPLAGLLADNDIDCEPGEPLVIRRSVKADGGSRAFVNDQPCSAALLRELSDGLIEIHGQHDDRGLINPRGHRALLDAYGRIDHRKTAALHAAWGRAEATYQAALDGAEKAEADREWLEHSIDEISRFAPVVGEEAELAGERADMMKGEKVAGDMEAVRETFEGSDGGLAALRTAARRLDRIAQDHELLAEALAALDRAVVEASEAEEKLALAAEALAFDPMRLEAIESRLFDLRALARKHRAEADELPALLAEYQARLTAITDGGASLSSLAKARDEARHAFAEAARIQHQARMKAAQSLDMAVAAELAPLKLDSARFETSVQELPEDRWASHGFSQVEFMISTNPGAPLAPLMKIASGGELSRFILALKVALAEEGGARTIIFDEIDRGVGGAVAAAIGDRLSRLAKSGAGQLLVVTHSPQVASKGQAHFLIAKSSEGTVTRTGVMRLDKDGRRTEIARMLSGEDITDEARAQADRLLEGV